MGTMPTRRDCVSLCGTPLCDSFPGLEYGHGAAKDRQKPVAFPLLVAGADVSPLAGVDIEAGVTITALLGSLVVRPLQGSCARLLRAGEVTRADG